MPDRTDPVYDPQRRKAEVAKDIDFGASTVAEDSVDGWVKTTVPVPKRPARTRLSGKPATD